MDRPVPVPIHCGGTKCCQGNQLFQPNFASLSEPAAKTTGGAARRVKALRRLWKHKASWMLRRHRGRNLIPAATQTKCYWTLAVTNKVVSSLSRSFFVCLFSDMPFFGQVKPGGDFWSLIESAHPKYKHISHLTLLVLIRSFFVFHIFIISAATPMQQRTMKLQCSQHCSNIKI